MKIFFGFILGFYFGLACTYTAITHNAPEIKEKPYYGVTYRGNLDTIYKIENTQEGFKYSDIIK